MSAIALSILFAYCNKDILMTLICWFPLQMLYLILNVFANC